MKNVTSLDPPAPVPRHEPLLIHRIASEELPRTRAYIELHGGVWMALADGGYLLTFPPGTVQWLEEQTEQQSVYHLRFPDGGIVIWLRVARSSLVESWPAQSSNALRLPDAW
jgi:hypothetical protein